LLETPVPPGIFSGIKPVMAFVGYGYRDMAVAGFWPRSQISGAT